MTFVWQWQALPLQQLSLLAEDLHVTCQQHFHQRWGHLHDPHVRALAWLLDSPNLLDPAAPQWAGRVASLIAPLPVATVSWLADLDQQPQALHDYLAIQPFTRLGRYAESLLAFYFMWQGILRAHGVQVHNAQHETIGEFDFLLQQENDVVHWEFAIKLYLLAPDGVGQTTDYFVGPNLADTFGNKIHKIFSRQLMLSQHPAAQAYLPETVARAQALLKGWLFYPRTEDETLTSLGIAANHCRGFWCSVADVAQLEFQHALILPRLSWLAPARVSKSQTQNRTALTSELDEYFSGNSMPQMVALLQEEGDFAIEVARGFIVPQDWRTRARAIQGV